MVRDLDLKKPPSIAESIDWARALLLLGADDIDSDIFTQTMSIIVKHRTDIDLVAERVGVRLGSPRAPRRRTGVSLDPGLGPRIAAFCEDLRAEGVPVGTSELLDAFAALETVSWTEAGRLPRGARRHRRQVARRPPHLRPDLRPLLLPRGRGRGDRPRASRGRPLRGRRAARHRRAPRSDPPGDRRGARGRHARPRPPCDRRLRPPRRGLGRRRRRRPAHPPLARAPAHSARRSRKKARRRRSTATASTASSATCAASSSAR